LRIFASLNLRKEKMNKLFLSVSLLFSSAVALAQPTGGGSGVTQEDLQLNTITTALPFMSITPDSRAGGMGDAGTALSPNSTSIYWNTAVLNFSEERSEVSVSYTPWLRQLTNDIHLSYVSAYGRIGDRHSVAGALRYFSLGSITFTDINGDVLREDKPSEFELTGGYAFKTSDRTSVGINGKFAYSNLTGGLIVGGIQTEPGIAGAADISFAFFNDEAKIGGIRGTYIFGATINNIGNKVKYNTVGANAPGDFLPMNLKIGNSFNAKLDKFNSLTLSIDLQKLLVPTPPVYDGLTGELASGMNNNIGVISGMLQSFYDAPGRVVEDANGDFVKNSDGSYQVVKGSKFKEEMSEINIATGLEYWYNNILAVRAGFFYESKNKGARQYFNAGVGFKYNKFGIDISYLIALQRTNPLANTLRFSLRYSFGGDSATSTSSTPQ